MSLIVSGMLRLHEPSLPILWGAVGPVEMILAALLGGWIYREGAGPAA